MQPGFFLLSALVSSVQQGIPPPGTSLVQPQLGTLGMMSVQQAFPGQDNQVTYMQLRYAWNLIRSIIMIQSLLVAHTPCHVQELCHRLN